MPDKMIKIDVSLRELQSLTEFVKAAYASGHIDERQARLFMHGIMAGDYQGNLWTVGTRTGRWYRKKGETWVEDRPSGSLFLAVPEKNLAEMQAQLAELKMELEIRASRVKKCLKCGSDLSADSRFCRKCGTAVSQPDKCPGCGKQINPGSNFCPVCGMKLK